MTQFAEDSGHNFWRFKWLVTRSPYRQESFWFSNSTARSLGLQPILGEIVGHGGVWQAWERLHTTVLSIAHRLPYNPRVRLWKLFDEDSPLGACMTTSWKHAGRLTPILDEILADGGSWQIWERKTSCSIVKYRDPKANPERDDRVLEFLKALRQRRRAREQAAVDSAEP